MKNPPAFEPDDAVTIDQETADRLSEEGKTLRKEVQERVKKMKGPSNEVEDLRAEVKQLRKERDEAQKNYEFMVKKACDEKLDGYRELGAKAAAAENECDRLRQYSCRQVVCRDRLIINK